MNMSQQHNKQKADANTRQGHHYLASSLTIYFSMRKKHRCGSWQRTCLHYKIKANSISALIRLRSLL